MTSLFIICALLQVLGGATAYFLHRSASIANGVSYTDRNHKRATNGIVHRGGISNGRIRDRQQDLGHGGDPEESTSLLNGGDESIQEDASWVNSEAREIL